LYLIFFSDIENLDWLSNDLRWKNDPANIIKCINITPEQKSLFLSWDPCQPMPDDPLGKTFKKDENGHFIHLWYYRIIEDGQKVLRDWLTYSPYMNKAFCLHCLLYGKSMRSLSSRKWTKQGFSVWKNGLMSISKLETTESHITSSTTVIIKAKCAPLLPALEHHNMMKVEMNGQTVNKLIMIVIFFSQTQLSFSWT